MAIREVKNG